LEARVAHPRLEPLKYIYIVVRALRHREQHLGE
jgi:hypothetical protein